MEATMEDQGTVRAAPTLTSTLTSADGRPVTIVHVVAELAPFARTGGLGEAVQSLATYQLASGVPTYIIMPLYAQARRVAGPLEPVTEAYSVQLGPRREYARLYQQVGAGDADPSRGARVYFLENDGFFGRAGIYGERGGDYADNARRYAFFPLAALMALPQIVTPPVILHTHDWHTALGPVYRRLLADYGDPFYRDVSTVLTVHNAGFQGHFAPETIYDVGLPSELFNWRQLEWHGKLNYLKGGLVFCDAATTVSPTHAHELRTPAGGFGLHDVFAALRDRFIGITNGIDQTVWDPTTDPGITANYSPDDLSGKRKDKTALQRLFGLTRRPGVPIFGMTARLTYQKGLELIVGDPGYFALDAQFIFLGAGEPRYEAMLTAIAKRAPGRIAVQLKFTERLEHRLLAGADMCLMPSLYEPCGLTQMRAQRYGTIPIARRVGGLADTIEDGVTGFLFDDYTPNDFMRAAVRAIDQWSDQDAWIDIMRDAMSRDFGWEKSAARYRDMYRRVLAVAGRHH